MPVKLNKSGFEHAKKLIQEGQFVWDERDAWSEHQPSTEKENEFIRLHGFLNTPSGISESTTTRVRKPRDDTSFLTVTFETSTAAALSQRKAAPANTSIPISNGLRPTFTT